MNQIVPPSFQFNPQTPFMFWVQKVLPLAFDDALSYYEAIAKMRNKLNETIKNMNQTGEAVQALSASYAELTQYVQKYFDELDLQPLMNEAINQSIVNGQLQPVITASLSHFYNPVFVDSVDGMINENYAFVLQYEENNETVSDIYIWNPNTQTLDEDEAILGGGDGPMEDPIQSTDPLSADYIFSGYQFGGVVTDISDMSGPLTGYVLSADNTFYFYNPQHQKFTKSDYLYGGIVTAVAQMAPVNNIYVLKSNYHVYAWDGQKFTDTGVSYGIVASDPSVQNIINQWLDNHPEATTTVQDGSITTPKLVNGAVTNAKIADGTITGNKIARGTISPDLIQATSITTMELANNAVHEHNINDRAVTTNKIADDSVTTDKIADAAVTGGKIARGAITLYNFNYDTQLRTFNHYVTPELFGAIGDGVTDDREAIQQAINNSNNTVPVLFPSSAYAVKGSLNLRSDTHLIGNNTTIYAISSLTSTQRLSPLFNCININHFSITDFNLNLLNPALPTVGGIQPNPFTLFSSCSDFSLQNITAVNFISDGSYGHDYPLDIVGSRDGSFSSFDIHNCNNFSLNNLTVTKTRRLGITLSNSSHGTIKNCRVYPEESHPENAGYLTPFNLLYCNNIYVYDSYFKNESISPTQYTLSSTCNAFGNNLYFFNTEFHALTGESVERTPGCFDMGHEIAEQESTGWNNIHCTNCTFTGAIRPNYSTDLTVEQIESFTVNNLTFTNCIFYKQYNTGSYLFSFPAGSAYLNNCQIYSYSWTFYLPYDTSLTCKDCLISSHTGNLVRLYRNNNTNFTFDNCTFDTNFLFYSPSITNPDNDYPETFTKTINITFRNSTLPVIFNNTMWHKHLNTTVNIINCVVNSSSTLSDENIIIRAVNTVFKNRLATTRAPFYLYMNDCSCEGTGGILNCSFNYYPEHTWTRSQLIGYINGYSQYTGSTILNGLDTPLIPSVFQVYLSNVQGISATNASSFPLVYSEISEETLLNAPLNTIIYRNDLSMLQAINGSRSLITLGSLVNSTPYQYTFRKLQNLIFNYTYNDTTSVLDSLTATITPLTPSILLFYINYPGTLTIQGTASSNSNVLLYHKSANSQLTGMVSNIWYDSSTANITVNIVDRTMRFYTVENNTCTQLQVNSNNTVTLSNLSISGLLFASPSDFTPDVNTTVTSNQLIQENNIELQHLPITNNVDEN